MANQGIVSCGITEHAVGVIKSVRYLRRLGCRLPVEFHTEADLPEELLKLMQPLDISTKTITETFASKFSNKIHACVHSDFDQIIFMDADIAFLENPEKLLDDLSFVQYGHLLWPDMEGEQRDGTAKTDSGVMLWDLQKHKQTLQQSLAFTEQHYAGIAEGGKESYFHVLGKINQANRRPDYAGFIEDYEFRGASMLQYFDEQPLFIHSTLMKFHFTSLLPAVWSHIGVLDSRHNIEWKFSNHYQRWFPTVNQSCHTSWLANINACFF